MRSAADADIPGVLAGAVLAAGLLASPAHATTVSGKVKDSVSGTLLSGVKVEIVPQPGKSANTNTSGVYSILDVSAGTVTLKASRSAYVTRTTGTLTVPSSGTKTAPDILLVRMGTITGKVVDASGGAAVSGATVQVTGTSTSATTDSSGIFILYRATGTYTLTVSRSGWATATTGSLSVTNNGTTSVPDTPLTQTATVQGSVRESGSGALLPGVSVKLHSAPGTSTTTDSSGAFKLSGVPVGSRSLDLAKGEYASQTTPSFAVVAGTNTVGPFLLDSAFGTMTGTVVETTTGVGLVGARVELEGDDSTAAETDWQGRYRLTRIPSGSRSLRVLLDGYAEASSSDVDIQPGQQAAVPPISLAPEPAHLTGVVRDGDTGEPVENVVLTSARTGATLVTDPSGTFSFDGLEPGYDVVAFQTDGTSPMVSDPVELPPGSTTFIELWTRAGGDGPEGNVVGVVRDTAGAPIEGATVTVPGFPSVETGADGAYSVAVPPGRHVVKAEKPGYRTVLSDHHGDNALFVSTNWRVLQDFVLPAADDTATLVVSTTDPIERMPRQGRIRLESLFAFFDVATGPLGESHTVTGVPAGPLLGWILRRALEPAGTTALEFSTWSDAPTTPPRWAAGGLVYRATSGEPVSGAVVTLSNPSEGYTTTVTTDGGGRWSFSSGPVGDYQVDFAADGGLAAPDPWTFAAADDGAVFVTDVGLEAPEDIGTLTIDEPAAGTVIHHAPLVVRCTASLPKPGDYVLAAEVSLSNGEFRAEPVVYEPDGKHFRIDLSEIGGEGDQALTVRAITRTGSFSLGNWPTASIPVTVRLATGPSSLSLEPAGVVGGASSTGTVRLNAVAPAGGLAVSLTSDSPVATVPPSVTVPEGAAAATVAVATLASASASVTITATANGLAATGILVVTAPGVLTGTVVSASGGQPVEGVTIRTTAGGYVTTTDGAGAFTVTVAPGAHTLSLAKWGWLTATFGPFTVDSGQRTAGGIMPLTQGGILTGRVRYYSQSARAWKAVSGAAVTVTGTSSSTVTDSSGRYALTEAAGEWTLSAAKSFFVTTTTAPVALEAGQEVTLDISLDRYGTILGSLVDSVTMQGVAGADVVLAGGGFAASQATRSAGNFGFDAPPGQYTISFTKPGWERRTLDVSLCRDCLVNQGQVRFVHQGTIAGIVVSAVDGAPIEGATVTVVGTSGSTVTGPSGAFSIAQNPGACTLAVARSGWAPRTTASLTVVGGQTTDAGVIALDHGGSLAGTVVSGTDGVPLPDVTVTIADTGEQVRSDGAGAFAFANLTPGTYSLTLVRAGWVTGTRTDLAVELGQTTDIGTVRLEQRGAVHGTVVSASDGTAVEGVAVAVTGTGSSTTTDARGEFVLSPPLGNHRLTLTKSGWASLTTAPLVVSHDRTAEAGVIQLHQLGTLRGRVVSALDGRPLDAKVVVVGTSTATVSKPQTGEFALGLPPGSYSLGLSHDWYAGKTTDPITVGGGQATDIGPVALTRLGWIEVRVLTEPSGVDLPGATVAAPAVGRSVTGTGMLTLPLPPGVHSLVVSRPGWLTRAIGPFTVASGERTTVNPVVLAAGGAIVGTVVRASDGAPVSGATVTVDGTGIDATTDDAGAFIVSPAQGDYALTVTKDGWPAATTAVVSVVKSHVTNAGLVPLSPRTGSLTGTVVGAADGSPVEGARVNVSGTSVSATTDSAGAFTLTHLTGSWPITVTNEGWASVAAGPFAVEAGQVVGVGAIALTQPAGTVTGTIVEPATGLGAAGVVVTVEGTAIATTTGATGAFSLSLTPGFLTLRATKGFGSVVSPILLVAAGATTPAGQLPLVPETGGLTGLLVDATSRAPLASTRVSLSGEGRSYSTSTDANGRFRFVAPPGSYSLTWVGAVTVVAGETTDLGSRPAGVGGTMVGLVRYSDGFTPLYFSTVAAAGGSPILVSESPGEPPARAGFAAPSPTGGGPITVSHPEANPLTTPPVFVDYGLVTDAGTLTVSENGTVSGTVRSPRGVPIGVETITINETGKRVESPYTHSCHRVSWSFNRPPWCTGHYTISEKPGAYTLTFDRHGYIGQTTTVIQFADTVHSTGVDLVLQPAPGYDIASFTVSPGSVLSGEGAVGEITLNGPMPPPVYLFDTTYVRLASSNPAVASVPTEVVFAVGEVSKVFPITTAPGAPAGPVTITATYAAGSVNATLMVKAEAVASLTLDPPAVRRGASSTGIVTLDVPARGSGVVVALASSDVSSATVPGSVTVPGGSSSASFTVTTLPSAPASSVTISATSGGSTVSGVLSLVAPSLTGVAPGWVLPGASAVVAYGTGFDDGSSVELAGPVYDLADWTTARCDVASGQCPTVALAGAANTDGTALTFAVPDDAGPGVYLLKVRTAAGVGTGNSRWLAVDRTARVYPALTPDDHKFATAIRSGQTVTGTFTAGGDPAGARSDFNAYYFIATAGSRISASLERVDTSRPWEHPDSIDPELTVVAPDGFVYQNLVKYDDRAGTDLDASLADAVLPQTGLYMILAGTSRGEGDYRLRFSVDEMAPAAVRVVPLSDVAKTVRLGDNASPAAIMLDPRGHPISGAEVSWSFTPSPDDRGRSEFLGATVLTGPDGSAQATVRAVGVGRVQYSPSFLSTFAAPRRAGLLAGAPAPVPRYAPVALRPFVVGALDGDGRIAVSVGPQRGLDVGRPHPRVEGRGRAGEGSAQRLGAAGIGDRVRPWVQASDEARPDAATAVPLALAVRLSAQEIGSCFAGAFAMGNIDASSVVTPLAVTLTDLTPSAGQSEPNGEIGVDGIHGHRVATTARLKIGIADALGNEPPHPVLISLRLGGSPDGRLILAPGVECRVATLLWHERDVAGNLIDPNEEFGYQLGTRALYVGATPDLERPGQVVPVWGTPELLMVVADPSDAPPNELPSVVTVPVHPEAGQPDRLQCYQGDDGQPCPDVFSYWSGYFTVGGGGGGPIELGNAYFLADRFGNTCFGYPSASATPPAANIQLEFSSQLGRSWDPAGYTLTTRWSNNPQTPQGRYASRLSVSYPDDPEWAVGVVVKDIELEFSSGEEHVVIAKPTYERRLGIEDGSFPLAVAPVASGEGLPKGTDGTGARLPLLLLAGEAVSGEVGLGLDEPSPERGKVWRWQSGSSFTYDDAGPPAAALEQAQAGEFRLSLVDGSFEVVPEGEFLVHRCPKGDHQPEAMPLADCPLEPVRSQSGVVDTLAVNPGGAGDGGSRGYVGIELAKAPVNPGPCFILVESRGPTKYRIRQQADYFEGRGGEEEHRGAFFLATVMGGEILDQNFQRIDPDLIIRQPTTAHVVFRTAGIPLTQASLDVSVDTRRADGSVFDPPRALVLNRLGTSTTFIGRITLRPPIAGSSGGASAQGTAPGPQLQAPGGPGLVTASLGASAFGQPGAAARTLVPRKLKIEFLEEDGRTVSDRPVVRVLRLTDPREAGHDLFVEECLARIVAILPDSLAPDPAADGFVGLRERGNEDLEGGLRRSYSEDLWPAATPLAEYENPQVGDFANKQYALLELIGGVGPTMALRSLAVPRRDSTGGSLEAWDAILVAQPTISSRARGYEESDPTRVPQWVDEWTYEAESGSSSVRASAGGNDLPDWLEAAAWDSVVRMRASEDAVVRSVGEAVEGIGPRGCAEQGQWAFVCFGDRTIRFNAANLSSGDTTARHDSLFVSNYAYHGLHIIEPHRLDSVVKHEARHCWQHKWADSSDGDGDRLPDSVPDAGAPALFDSSFTGRYSGGNPEFDFSLSYPDDPELVRDAVERDAMRWEVRTAGANVANNLACIESPVAPLAPGIVPIYDLHPVQCTPPCEFGVSVNANGRMPTSIWGSSGAASMTLSERVTGIVVRLSRETDPIPGDGESERGSAEAWVVDPREGMVGTGFGVTTGFLFGTAEFKVILGPGLNIFSATAHELTEPGDGSGAQAKPCGWSRPEKIYFRVRVIP